MKFNLDLETLNLDRIKTIWSLDESAEIIDVTGFGDFFVSIEGGSVLYYSLTDGCIEDVTELVEAHGLPPEEVGLGDEWYQLDAQTALFEAEQTLSPEQCFTFIKPIFEGGEYEPANVQAGDLYGYHEALVARVEQGR